MSYQYDDGYPRSSAGPGLNGNRRTAFSRHGFSLAFIMGDPFSLSTISLAIIGWIIALGGSIAVEADGQFPTLTWWGIAFQFCLIIGIIYLIGANVVNAYKNALMAFLAVAIIYTTNSTNNFVWTGTPASGAAAAGHILLSIINILWTFYFGTTEEARLHAFVDSFLVHEHGPMSGSRLNSYNGRPNPFGSEPGNNGDMGIGMSNRFNNSSQLKNQSIGSGQYPQMFTSAQLGQAFENTTQNNNNNNNSKDDEVVSTNDSNHQSNNGDALTMPSEYPYKAKAIYSYQANPADANELSFEKGEILEVSDITGRWWQARRENGEVGICPSNYVQLLD